MYPVLYSTSFLTKQASMASLLRNPNTLAISTGVGLGAMLSYLKQKSEIYSGRSNADRVDPFGVAAAGLIGGGLGFTARHFAQGILDPIRRKSDDFHAMSESTQSIAKRTEDLARSIQALTDKAQGRFYGIFNKSSSTLPSGRDHQNEFLAALTGMGTARGIQYGVKGDLMEVFGRDFEKLPEASGFRAAVGKTLRPTLRWGIPWMVGGGLSGYGIARMINARAEEKRQAKKLFPLAIKMATVAIRPIENPFPEMDEAPDLTPDNKTKSQKIPVKKLTATKIENMTS